MVQDLKLQLVRNEPPMLAYSEVPALWIKLILVDLSSVSSRDPRLDFFRGLALLCIFIDHTPGNRLTDYTIHNLGFSDASELFVFISAYAAGLVYMARANRDGLMAASRRVWQRVVQLYVAHLLLLATVALLANWIVRKLHDQQFVNGMNVRPLLERPAEIIPHALALTFQPTFMNILPLYIALLAFLPLVLWLIRRSQGLALLLSVLLYVVAREFPVTLDNPFGTVWQFNPLAWQLLFVIGVSLGASAQGGTLRVPRSVALFAAAAVYAAWALWLGGDKWGLDGSTVPLPPELHVIVFPVMERANLSLWRLAHILSLAYLVSYVLRAESRVFRAWPSRVLVLCGQHSLALFCAGVLLSLAGWVAFVRLGSTLGVQVLVNAGGIAVLAGVAWVLSLRTRYFGGRMRRSTS